jgi:hypothetical protein
MDPGIPLEIVAHARETPTRPPSWSSASIPADHCDPVPSLICHRQDSHPVARIPQSSRGEQAPSFASVDQEPEGRLAPQDTQSSTAELRGIHPADRGAQAWLYLLGAFVVETLVWGEYTSFQLLGPIMDQTTIGFPNSFGVFLGYYSQMFDKEPGAESLLPLAGTLCSGVPGSIPVIDLPAYYNLATDRTYLLFRYALSSLHRDSSGIDVWHQVRFCILLSRVIQSTVAPVCGLAILFALGVYSARVS